MTANELFLKHVTQHLGQYQGNLRYFCEAVANGHVPAADDETVRPFVQLLKRHMRVATASDGDELLLRFGLIVPGLMRGIHPPVSVLSPERGGFSDKRLEQAAGQVARLRDALRLGRRFFNNLSSDSATALQEIAEHIRTAFPSDDTWVQIHASLPDAEARSLAERAFNCLDEPAEPNDLGVGILASLANFRHDGLGEQIAEALKRNLHWPSSIYRDAPDDVAKGLIQQIGGANGLQLNHLLLALAWTRGEPARRAFVNWRNTPPRWAGSLHVPTEDYLQNAGWTLDANGQRSELVSASCYRIVPSADSSAARFAVPCRTEIESRCPACRGSLAWLFDFTNLPDEFFSEGRTGAPRRIFCCLHCACFCPGVFSSYQPDGTVEWHSATESEETSNFGGRPPSVRELIPAGQPPFATAEPFGICDATSFGGVPMWLQDAQYPRCPDCQNAMRFLAQFDNGSMPQPEEGIYYAFFCGKCQVAAVNYQQT